MEAMAAGTPVIAFASGALPDIVVHGRTGFIVRDADEMADALHRVSEIDPDECRRTARERFALERMVERYFALYEQIALVPHWEDLFARCPEATPFQHPAWVLGWWWHFGNGSWTTVTTWRGNTLAAIAPLFEWERRNVFIGSGITDYNDILAESGVAPDIPRPAELTDIPEWSALGRREPCAACPVAQIGGLPVKLRKKLRYARRRLDALGEVSFEQATAESLDEFLDALFHWHSIRWQSRESGGVLAETRTQRFHRYAAHELLRAGLLRLYGLRVDGVLRGALYCLDRNGRVYYYISGFDPQLAAFSPGSLLIRHAWEQARAAGDREFDFLRGSEAYKYAWGARDRWTYKLTLTDAS
jgi:CelD/BcsL family acetyltransferase involved in cellulose biosynthesis